MGNMKISKNFCMAEVSKNFSFCWCVFCCELDVVEIKLEKLRFRRHFNFYMNLISELYVCKRKKSQEIILPNSDMKNP